MIEFSLPMGWVQTGEFCFDGQCVIPPARIRFMAILSDRSAEMLTAATSDLIVRDVLEAGIDRNAFSAPERLAGGYNRLLRERLQAECGHVSDNTDLNEYIAEWWTLKCRRHFFAVSVSLVGRWVYFANRRGKILVVKSIDDRLLSIAGALGYMVLDREQLLEEIDILGSRRKVNNWLFSDLDDVV